MKTYINIIFSTLLIISMMSACKNGTSDKHLEQDKTHEHHEEENTHLSKEQIKTIDLQFGDFTKIKINQFIKTTGVLGLPPNAFSSVNAKYEGTISGHKKFIEGDFIHKGENIAYLENPDFIVKQQDFLKTKAQLELQKIELNRQQELIDANAGIPKNLQTAQAKLNILEAEFMGLKQQLNYLGIATQFLNAKNIVHQIPIKAPMSGFITKINMYNGVYVQPNISLMEIVANDHIHLELDVFEKDIDKIKVGQKISYTTPAINQEIYSGEVSVIGKEFNGTAKTVRVHGHLEEKRPIFIKDLFINAKIWLNNETVNALPESAVLKENGNEFIYVAKINKNNSNTEFLKINVKSGATNNGFTQVTPIDKIPENMQIVTQGAYYVYAQSKNGELSHEH
ncbi:efflux RND transporter periplasmic adaptor subunit [Wenyingzhuangia sp. IMCC45467]